MVVDASAPTGFVGWIQENGQLVLFFAQLAYWLVICVAAVWATLVFRKLVNATVVAKSAAMPDAVAAPVIAPPIAPPIAPAASTAEKPSIDEFVD